MSKKGLEAVAETLTTEFDEFTFTDGCFLDEPVGITLERSELTEEAWNRIAAKFGLEDGEYVSCAFHMVVVNVDEDTCHFPPPEAAEPAE